MIWFHFSVCALTHCTHLPWVPDLYRNGVGGRDRSLPPVVLSPLVKDRKKETGSAEGEDAPSVPSAVIHRQLHISCPNLRCEHNGPLMASLLSDYHKFTLRRFAPAFPGDPRLWSSMVTNKLNDFLYSTCWCFLLPSLPLRALAFFHQWCARERWDKHESLFLLFLWP